MIEPKTFARIAASVRFTESLSGDDPRRLGLRYAFELLDDASGGQAIAKILTLDAVTTVSPFARLKYKWGILDGARAGYKGDCVPYNGVFYLAFGPCFDKCESAATLDPDSPPHAVIGESYSHSISTSGIDEGTIEVEGLPSGLTADDEGTITGTPASGTAGSYAVVFSGEAPKTGPAPVLSMQKCTITKVAILVVEEEPD